MQINVPTAQNYRRATKELTIAGMQFYSFVLYETVKKLVMRGLPVGVSTHRIKDDLIEQRVKIIDVHAMHAQREPRKVLPVYLVKTTNEEDSITSITWVMQDSVKWEHQRTKTAPSQCYRCQGYDPTQTGCDL